MVRGNNGIEKVRNSKWHIASQEGREKVRNSKSEGERKS